MTGKDGEAVLQVMAGGLPTVFSDFPEWRGTESADFGRYNGELIRYLGKAAKKEGERSEKVRR